MTVATTPQPRPSNRVKTAPLVYVVRDRGASVGSTLNNRFVAGDPESIRELYREYGRALYGVAFRILGDHSWAEESVQQTFLKAWRAADRFDPERDIAPWLFTIGKRVALDIYRREKRHTTDALGDREIGLEAAGIESTYAVFEVRRALENLPDEEKAVLMATHFTGLSHGQAADTLGIPVGTVKSRAYRAYRRLEASLAHMKEVNA